ncbi:diacylglycerol kinase [Brucella tritici]
MDHVSQDYPTAARHAKDLGSFAVMCLIVANVIFVAYVFFGTHGGTA